MKKLHFALLGTILLILFYVTIAKAQVEQLTLKISRDWGYGGLNGDIEGLFSMKVNGAMGLVRVEYFIDSIKIGEVTQAPFNLQFTTDNYPIGIHKLYAIGYSNDGSQYQSNSISVNFVPKQSSAKSILPILGIVLAAVLFSALVPLITRRGKRLSIPLGSTRLYGAGGGGICPICHRPFALPFISIHLGFSRLTTCPFCGKWSLVRIESMEKLREAEKAELERVQPDMITGDHNEQDLLKEIGDSKYQDL
jgi:hypothetical protein